MDTEHLDFDELREIQDKWCTYRGLAFFGEGALSMYNLSQSDLSAHFPKAALVIGGIGAAAYIGTFCSSRIPSNLGTDKLSRKGVYGALRNPIYACERIIVLGFLVLSPAWDVLALGAAHFATTERLANLEEQELEVCFPQEYPKYREEVHGWIPYGKDLKDYVNKAIEKVKATI